MKKTNKMITVAFAVMIASTTLWFSACQKEKDPATPGASTNLEMPAKSDNSYVFPIQSDMYGKSYADWSVAWWQWVFSFDCAHNPLLDNNGSLQNQNQSGHVFFVGGGEGGPAVTRAITISSNQSLFFPLVNYYANYPCGPGQPAPGQTMQQYLTSQVLPFKPLMDQLSLTVDGNSVGNLTDYWALTSLFNYTGNADLANCIDACINGQQQPAVSGGYWIMLKPLGKGTHVVHVTGGASSLGFLVDVTYNVTVD